MTSKTVAETRQHSVNTPTRYAMLGSTSDFSPVASCYDATRVLPRSILLACYDRLIAPGLLPDSRHRTGCRLRNRADIAASRGKWLPDSRDRYLVRDGQAGAIKGERR